MKTITAAIVCLFMASWVSAQDKGYVQGVGGLTFQSETSGVFGGEFGANLTSDINVSRFVGGIGVRF